MKDLILPPDHSIPMGVLEASDYARVAGELKKSGLIKEMPDYNSFFARCDRRVEK